MVRLSATGGNLAAAVLASRGTGKIGEIGPATIPTGRPKGLQCCVYSMGVGRKIEAIHVLWILPADETG
ncbi:MAG: hypothetical protein WEH44_02765 [Pirellulaceae bacterium]